MFRVIFTAVLSAAGGIARCMVGIGLDDDEGAGSTVISVKITRTKSRTNPRPGSALIISNESKDSAILPKGGDFIVLAKSVPLLAETPKAKAKRVAVARPKVKSTKRWKRTVPAYAYHDLRNFNQDEGFFFGVGARVAAAYYL